MEDHRDPFYTPFGQPIPKTARQPGELLWEVVKDHVGWSCELTFLGESYGWQALICRAGELAISHRFILREHVIQWSEDQRRDIERGWIDELESAGLESSTVHYPTLGFLPKKWPSTTGGA